MHEENAGAGAYDAIVFDLLTALIDSWSLWNCVAGSEVEGLAWRKQYLRLTYGAGAYRDYETIVAEAAVAAGLRAELAADLTSRWDELTPWPEAVEVVAGLGARAKIAVVTNCSVELGRRAAQRVHAHFDVVMTAEQAGFYKPRAEPYARTLAALGTAPERTLYVAGSAADIPGASALGMPVYWHNRIGLAQIGNVAPLHHEQSLSRLGEVLSGGAGGR